MKQFSFSSKFFNFILLLVGLLFNSYLSVAQIAIPNSFSKEHILETRMYDYTSIPAYLKLKSGIYTLENAKQILVNTLNPKGEVSLELLTKESDEIGMTHYRYQQSYKGYPIFGAMYILHEKGGFIVAVNGFLYDQVNVNSVQMAEQTALIKSLAFIGDKKYKWEDSNEEAFLKEVNKDPNATYYPKGALKIVADNGDFYTKTPNLRLCYAFNIETVGPEDVKEIFVDASNGEIVYTNQILMHVNTFAKAKTGYSDTQTIVTDQTTPTTFLLRETNRGGGGCNLYTYNNQNGKSGSSTNNFSDADNFWNNVNANYDEYATDAHWGAEMTFDYFKNKHNRNSINDNGFALISRVHYDVKSFANASWNGQFMSYGDANGKPFTAVDIAGHEISHGLTSNTSKLIYQNESGALNESFSDIFGVSIDFYSRPNKANWSIGEELGLAIRSMSNPKSSGDPNYYFGINWYPLTTTPNQLNDQGGVHTNSSVQNYWFYLLTIGGNGKNEKNINFSIKGIGIDSSAKIAFRTNTFYLVNTSKYADAYFYSLKATEDLYGICSEAYRSNQSAWSAVGFGKPGSPNNTTDFTSNKVEGCSLPFVVNLDSKYQSKSASWRIDGIGLVNGDNTSISISKFGTYAVTLITDNGCKIDSITKSQYLTVSPPSAPKGVNGNRLDPGSIVLSSIKDTGLIEWFDAPVGGNLLDANDEYTTPFISKTTYYYIQKSVPGPLSNVGPKDNTIGLGANEPQTSLVNYLVFDCLKECTLVSVLVHSAQSKERTFQLRDENNEVLQEQKIQVPFGKQTVNLNFSLPIQDNLRLAILDSESPQLFKSTSGIFYPYNLQDMISIKSSGAANTYPFFYNWTIQDAPCISNRVLVKAIINNLDPLGIVNFKDQVKIYPNPSKDYIYIEQIESLLYDSYSITDMQGRLIIDGEILNKEKLKIDLIALSKGIYNLKLKGNQVEDLNNKIILE